jgi:hypothetical protein
MSLLDEGTTTTPDGTPENSGETSGQPGTNDGQSPSWFWDENTPGQGERPQFLPEKYKSVADVAKAYKELESRLGTAPKEYDFSKGDSWMEPDYEPFQHMADFAKSKHVPQDVMDKMLETVGLYLDEFRTDMTEEKAKLGENATQRLQTLNNWAQSNLSEKAFATLSASMRSADAIEALEEIRNRMINNATMVPGGNTNVSTGGMTIEEYRSELNANYAKFKTDPAYRKEMNAKLERIVGSN